MKQFKRIISMLLALTMLVGMLPVTAMAAEEYFFAKQPRKVAGNATTGEQVPYGSVLSYDSEKRVELEWGDEIFYILRTGDGSDYDIKVNTNSVLGNYIIKYENDSDVVEIVDSSELRIAKVKKTSTASDANMYWAVIVPIKDKPSNAPAAVTMTGTLNIYDGNQIVASLTPSSTNYKPYIANSEGEVFANQTNTVPHIYDSSTGNVAQISGAGSSSASVDYGETIYYILRAPLKETGSIFYNSDNFNAENYTLSENSDQIESINIVNKNYSSGERWYVALKLIDDPGNGESTTITGSFSLKHKDAKETYTFNFEGRNVVLTGDPTLKQVKNISPVPLYINNDSNHAGKITYVTSGATGQERYIKYGTPVYFALRSGTTASSNIIADSTSRIDVSAYSKPVLSSGATGIDEDGLDYAKVDMVDESGNAVSYWCLVVPSVDEGSDIIEMTGIITINDKNGQKIAEHIIGKDMNNYNTKTIYLTPDVVEKAITGMSALPLRDSDGDGKIEYAITGASTARTVEFGTIFYYCLRVDNSSSNFVYNAGSTIDSSRYEVTVEDAVGIDTNGMEITTMPADNGNTYWVVKVPTVSSGSEGTKVSGTFTITDTASGNGKEVFSRNITAKSSDGGLGNDITLVTEIAASAEKIVTKTSTAPQYVADGETGIEQNGTSASGSTIKFGTDIYFLLRTDDGDIYDPDYVVPGDYTITLSDAKNISIAENNEDVLVLGTRKNGDKRWYVKLTLTDDDSNGPVYVEGTLNIQHKDASKPVTLNLTARNILVSSSTDLAFNGFSSYYYSYNAAVGALRSISGSSTGDFPVIAGDTIYLAAMNGGKGITDSTAINPDDYTIVYTPGESNCNFFSDISLVYETAYVSSAYTSRWHLALTCSDDVNGGEVADGIIYFYDSDNNILYELDLSKWMHPYFASEDDSILVSKVDTTKYVEVDGAVGRAGYDFPQIESSNIAFGETVYYMLMGKDSNGNYRPVTSSKAVDKIKIKTDWEQNGDKVANVEIIKKRCVRDGYEGYCYFLAITAIEKPTWTTRYTVLGTITLEKDKKEYPINTYNHEVEFDVDVTFGPEKVQSRVDVEDETDEDEFTRLDEIPRRYEFGPGKLEEDKEDVFYFFAMGDDSYFTVNTENQPNILLGNDVVYNEEIGARYPEAQLFFFNGTGKDFVHYGEMTLAAEPGTYLYERVGNMLLKIDGLRYDEQEGAFKFRTRKIGSYVFSDRELDYDRYNVSRIAPWAQGLNEDNSLSTLSGRQYKGAYVEYGSKLFFALRNGENKDVDKTITERMAIDPANFSFAFESSDPNAPSLKYADLVFHENLIKSSNNRYERWYVAMQFAEVPDPGVPRTVTGDFVMLYKGEELLRMTMGKTTESDSTYDGDYTITLHGGRPVQEDWIPADYTVPVLRTADEIANLPVSDMLESESDGDSASSETPSASTVVNDAEASAPAADHESGVNAE